MSSPNSNNEFEELDDPFGASGIASDGLQEDMPFDSELGAPEGEAENFTPVPNEDGVDNAEPIPDGVTPDDIPPEQDAPVMDQGVAEVQYKKAHCWDLFSWLLFISWLALLGGIVFLWLECPPSEYGDPPFKESSVPVKTDTP